MTIRTLSSVTLQTIKNYRHAAELSVQTYQTGSNRLIHALNNTLAKNVDSRAGRVAPKLTDRLVQVRGGLTDIMVKGVDNVSAGTEKVIELGSNTATKGVTQGAKFAAGIENLVAANGVEAVVRLSMPGAEVARALSEKIAVGAGKLSRAAAGKPVKAPRAVKSMQKTAVRAKRTVVRKATATKAAVTSKAGATSRKAVASTKATVARAQRKVAAVARA
jgi:hypothetical protein